MGLNYYMGQFQSTMEGLINYGHQVQFAIDQCSSCVMSMWQRVNEWRGANVCEAFVLHLCKL